jgi:hypothetical protein
MEENIIKEKKDSYTYLGRNMIIEDIIFNV